MIPIFFCTLSICCCIIVNIKAKGKMRIIAGSKRGMRLLSPKGLASRPITDRVKESLFSVLFKYDLLDGRRVADLFCGVGSLGLEALSRGAEFATFVEQDARIISILEKNIAKAGFVKDSKLISANAFEIGAAVDCDGQNYSVIFFDPPYKATRQTNAGSPLAGLLNLLAEQLTSD